jgi:sulfatase maturation enzyme AslB (radical SAM superfamily)
MSNRTLKNTSFCVLPFIEKFQNLNGKSCLCCNSSIPVKESELDNLRLEILNQKPIPHCTTCYQQEQHKIISPRQLETSRWLRDTEVKNYIDNWQPGIESKIFFYDIRFDNKCNLACISCYPGASSLWARELNITPVKHDLNFDISQALTAKKVYLAGGEPLIIDQFIDFIQQVSQQDQQPELVINTNLTRINDELKHILMQIKNLTLVVSIDAYGSVNEYHRWPMSWNKLVNNLEWANTINCTLQFNTVVDAVSVLNLQQIQELEHFADQWNLTILTRPVALAINNLPERLKSSVLHNFTKIKKSKFYTKDPVFKSRVNAIEHLILEPGNEQLLNVFIGELDQRRQINHTSYLGVQLT